MTVAILGVVVGIVFGSSGLFVVLVFMRRKSAKQLPVVRPVNYLGGLVLPMPDDARWRGNSKLVVFGEEKLGYIRVEDGCRLFIKGKQLPTSPQADTYCKAVVTAQRRQCLEKISREMDALVQEDDLSASIEKLSQERVAGEGFTMTITREPKKETSAGPVGKVDVRGYSWKKWKKEGPF